jgi:hypothetical protein
MTTPLIVLGFGRSGTTWLADMLSKYTGELVLFEPLHPSVTEQSRAWSYRNDPGEEAAQHLRTVLRGGFYRPWLLRNHIQGRIEDARPLLLDYLWNNCSIVGFKEIRLNFAIPWLVEHELGRVLFIVKHPHDVVTSILNRPNFWEFGGRSSVYQMIASHDSPLDPDAYSGEVERIAAMWAITHLHALRDCAAHGVPVVNYEALKRDPIATLHTLAAWCNLPHRPIHPSYVLPAALTTRAPTFWERTLTHDERCTIDEIIDRCGVLYRKQGEANNEAD